MKYKSILLGLAICMILMFIFPISVYAEESVENGGLQVTVTSDKSEYNQGDSVQIKINIKNTSDNVIKDMEVTNILSNELELTAGSETKWSVDKVLPKKEVNFNINAKIKVSTPTNSEPDVPAGGNVVYPSTATNYYNMLLMGVVLLVVSIILFVLTKKGVWSKILRKLSLLVMIIFVVTNTFVKKVEVQAAENSKPITVTKEYKILCNSKEFINTVNITAASVDPRTVDNPTVLKINNQVDKNKVLRVNGDSVEISGTVQDEDGINDVKYQLISPLGAEASGSADGKENWKVKISPKVGTSTLKITAVDALNIETSETIYLDKLSTEIKMSDKVWAPDKTLSNQIVSGIVDYWKDNNGTPNDNTDDGIVIICKEDDPIVNELKASSPALKAGSVIMLPQSDKLIGGFTGKIVNFGEPSALNIPADHVYPGGLHSYPDSQFEFIRTVTPDMRDMYADDVRIDFTAGVNKEDPIAFAVLPTGTSISMQDPSQRTLGKFEVQEVSEENPDGVKGPGFQWHNLSGIMKPQFQYNNDGSGVGFTLNYKDIVLYDQDGDRDEITKTDRVTLGGKIGIENLKDTGGIEWHPSLAPWEFDVLPQQMKFKSSYDIAREITADIGGSLNLEDLVKQANRDWQGFENKVSLMGLDIEGVSMDDAIIIGSIGFNLNLVPIQGNLSNQAKMSLGQPILVVMLALDIKGELQSKISITFKYNSYNERGFNLQKKGFVGPYGPLENDLGQSHYDAPFDRSVEVYSLEAKSKSEPDKMPVSQLSIEAVGKAESSVGIGPMIGIMFGGLMPATVRAVGYIHSKEELNGKIVFDAGEAIPSVKPDRFSINIDAGVKAVACLNFKFKDDKAGIGLSGKWASEFHLFEYNWEAIPYKLKGKISKADFDRDTTNNPVLSEVKITAVKDGVLISPPKVVTTDSNGEYEFKDLVNGDYTITFSKPGYVDYSTNVKIDDDKTLDIIMDVIGHSKLHGKITKADTDTDTTNNIPLGGVSIHVNKLFTSSVVDKTSTSDPNGNYSIDELNPGIYMLTASYQGYFNLLQFLIINENQDNVYNGLMEIIPEDYNGLGTASGIITNALTGKGVEQGIKLIIRKGLDNTSEGEVAATVYTGADGRYDVVLPAGNYCVEVIDGRTDSTGMVRYQSGSFNIKVLGAQDIRNQNGVITPILPNGQIRIVLKWGSTPLDLDSHLVGPTIDGSSKFHIYYSNKRYSDSDGSGTVKYADLDVDDISSYGPETTTIYKQSNGIYKFYIHDFSNRTYNSSWKLANSGAVVEIYMGSSGKPVAVYNVPNKEGTLWSVFEYDSNTKNIKGINSMSYESSPSRVGSGSANLTLNGLSGTDNEKK